MKRILQAFTSFSRLERMGLMALSVVLFVLCTIWQTMEWWLPGPKEDKAEQEKLAAVYREFVKRQEGGDLNPSDPVAPPDAPHLFVFDPNTLDSTGFRKLGLSAKVVKGLMNWRRHGKKFYRKEDLKPLYNLTPEEYDRLAPYIVIAETENRVAFHSSYPKLPPLPATLDLNTTDSATLVRLNGIGPTLAHKIMERRKVLGGYLRHEQLMEIYKFSDSTLTLLKQKLFIRPEAVIRIPVNKATVEQLQQHPYIGEKTAKNIVLYRNALKHFDNIQQLRQVPLMNEEIYRKIAPYLVIE